MSEKKERNFELVTTKGGDKGESSLFSGERLVKSDIRFEALGDLDELISYIGVLRENTLWAKEYHEKMQKIQKKIIFISGLIATNPKSHRYEELLENNGSVEDIVDWLEEEEEKLYNQLRGVIESEFIIPGDNKQRDGAMVHYARALSRRCERSIVAVIRNGADPRPDLHDCQRFINRLSDYLFILSHRR